MIDWLTDWLIDWLIGWLIDYEIVDHKLPGLLGVMN